MIILTAVLIALAGFIAVQVLGVLYGIVLPPLPPVPESIREISHESEAHGVDRWEYSAPGDACAVVSFYETNGGSCQMAASQCGHEGSDQVEYPADAVCSGQVPFSIFNMRWSVTIFPDTAVSSLLDVRREVYWIGTGPAAAPQFDLGQLSPSSNATTAP